MTCTDGTMFPDFPFVFKPDNPDQTHDFRSDTKYACIISHYAKDDKA